MRRLGINSDYFHHEPYILWLCGRQFEFKTFQDREASCLYSIRCYDYWVYKIVDLKSKSLFRFSSSKLFYFKSNLLPRNTLYFREFHVQIFFPDSEKIYLKWIFGTLPTKFTWQYHLTGSFLSLQKLKIIRERGTGQICMQHSRRREFNSLIWDQKRVMRVNNPISKVTL